MSESANQRISEGLRRFVGKMLIVLAVCALMVMPTMAQEEDLNISVSKQFGYNMGSQIQGTFKIRVRGPEDLTTVIFFLDGETLGEATTAPFELSFKTGEYAPGWHEIAATGTTSGGHSLTSRTLSFQFVSAEDAGKAAVKLIVPILVLVVVAVLATGIFPLLSGRKKPAAYDPDSYTPSEPRSYGVLGAVVCPKCGRPFGMHWWGVNISFVGKFDRCPHCGKWSLVRRASREELMAAEAAEYAAHTASSSRPAPDAEEKLREQLDDSRFTDHI
ncbi:MAG: Ig-like domain-containing protein [Anaerolineae bacterium]